MTHFSLLGLDPCFDLDPKALEAAYFAAQRHYHPDRFIGKPAIERQQALQRSMDINRAYETLKHPHSRAQYLLHLQGIEVGTEAGGVKPSPTVLMESIAWRERIDEAGREEMHELSGLLNEAGMQLLKTISASYRASAWEEMAQATLRLGYLLKARGELDMRRARLS